MPSIEEIASEIVRREGGYVNDPDDPGGATKYGVTIHTMRRLGVDLDGDGDVDEEDVKLLTIQQATKIFIDHYFQKPGIWRLPLNIQPSVFDMQVNAGSNAVEILQRLLVNLGDKALKVDGKIGPQTASAAASMYQDMGELLVDAYGIERRNYYYALGDRRPSLRKYARRRDGGKGGWIKRAEEFISQRFHLTDAQHRERVASWE